MKKFFPLWMVLSLMLCIFAAPYATAGTIIHTYDNAGRLVKTDYGGGKTIAYTYDNNGNLLKRDIQLPGPQEYVYVNKDDGTCGGKSPCYTSIQDAINGTSTGVVIRIAQGAYSESMDLTTSKSLTLQGGWDSSYTTQTSNKTFIKAPKATQGSLTLQMLTVSP